MLKGSISLVDLSVNATVTEKDGFVALRCYFDGSNQSDRRQYKTMTLCAVAGTNIQWGNLEERWQRMLTQHGAEWVHTTDMVTLNGAFTKSKGWTKQRVHSLLEDCAKTIEACSATPQKGWEHGVIPISLTIHLDGFAKAASEQPLLRTPELSAAEHCFQMCGHWAEHVEVRNLQLIFDQNESFYGHIRDRWTSRRARREESAWRYVTACSEADSRKTPGLQVADLVAWSVSRLHEHKSVEYSWQRRILKIHKERRLWKYRRLSKPIVENLAALERWGIPKRKAYRS